MKKKIFICERPLQILIVHSIMSQLADCRFIEVCIVGAFSNASKVFSGLSRLKLREETELKYFGTYEHALKYALSTKNAEVFIHWDVGFRMSIKLMLAKSLNNLTVNVYEEGLGTYKRSIFTGLKEKIFLKIGVSINCGGHSSTNSIYVFDPVAYKNNAFRPARKIIKIEKSIDSFMSENREVIATIFDVRGLRDLMENDDMESCVIYMTNYTVNITDIECLRSRSERIIIKAHPHMKEQIKTGFPVFVCPNEVPAELLIDMAANKYKRVQVFHNGSSVSGYIRRGNLTFVDRTKDEN